VTGEPGSGKSTFLQELVIEWTRTTPPLRLGTRVPVVVRCRDLALEDVERRDPDVLPDRLWSRRAPLPPETAQARPFHASPGRTWEPLWLIDGLDELPGNVLDETLCHRLAALPGYVCATCRTAVAHAEGRAFRGSVTGRQGIELLPLSPDEQKSFLVSYFGGDEKRAAVLHSRVQDNAQLREISGSPLLLKMIAEFGEVQLPASRAGFYAEAVIQLWERRVKGADRDRLQPFRDGALAALAGSMALQVQAPVHRQLSAARCEVKLACLGDRRGQHQKTHRHFTGTRPCCRPACRSSASRPDAPPSSSGRSRSAAQERSPGSEGQQDQGGYHRRLAHLSFSFACMMS
jgi:hypothetical protein